MSRLARDPRRGGLLQEEREGGGRPPGAGQLHAVLGIGTALAPLLLIPAVGGQASTVVVLGVAGLACSAFLPLSISFATREFPGRTEAVSGLMMASFMVGYGLGAYGVGPVRELGGLSLSAIYSGSSVFAAVMVLLAFAIVRAPRARLASAS